LDPAVLNEIPRGVTSAGESTLVGEKPAALNVMSTAEGELMTMGVSSNLFEAVAARCSETSTCV